MLHVRRNLSRLNVEIPPCGVVCRHTTLRLHSAALRSATKKLDIEHHFE